jgi:hypothetical protein
VLFMAGRNGTLDGMMGRMNRRYSILLAGSLGEGDFSLANVSDTGLLTAPAHRMCSLDPTALQRGLPGRSFLC